MIKCKELNKEFATKEELFRELKANKQLILDAKKAEYKTKQNNSVLGFYDAKEGTVKAMPNEDSYYIYPVISNTNYLDSHKDVHLNGSMTKTAREQNGKVYYVADHKLEVDSVIATPKNVEVMLKELSWLDLGRNYEGKTEALIFKIKKDNIIHPKFKQMIDNGEELQNSIRMVYYKIEMGFNSDDKEFIGEKKVYDEIYPSIVNKELLEEEPYFFAVRELGIFKEGSAVLFGSNDATPIQSKEADSITSEQEPSTKDTQFNLSEGLKNININL